MMTWFALFISVYAAISFLFFEATCGEGRADGGRWDWPRAAGLALCIVWPAALAIVLISAFRYRQAG